VTQLKKEIITWIDSRGRFTQSGAERMAFMSAR
jgi:hypothetical protein